MSLEQVWNEKEYQDFAEEKIRRKWRQNPGYLAILASAKKANTIVELGCATGAFLDILKAELPKKTYIGLDVAFESLKVVYKRKLGAIVADSRKVPIDSDSVDLVYTTHALEHIESPQQAVDEAIRIVKPGGKLIIICPNYATPLARLPGKTMWHTLLYLPFRILKSFWFMVLPPQNLQWQKLIPLCEDIKEYEPDYDAVNQPNLQTLEHYLKTKGMKIDQISSGLDWPGQKVNGLLGKLTQPIKQAGAKGIPPFMYYGFLCFIEATKEVSHDN